MPTILDAILPAALHCLQAVAQDNIIYAHAMQEWCSPKSDTNPGGNTLEGAPNYDPDILTVEVAARFIRQMGAWGKVSELQNLPDAV